MPIGGILNTAKSLGYYLRLQEVTANNLANANTEAFKADRLTAHHLPGGHYPVPVETTDLKQGTFTETGRPLDISLDGPGYFVIGTDRGERLSRGGSFTLDPAGRLTDSHGAPVLGVQGPILIQGGAIEVRGDGTILVDGVEAGRLRVETVEDPRTLQKEGRGYYLPGGPTAPVADDSVTRVRHAAVEESNIDTINSMVDLVAIQRAYAANLDALRTMDGVLGTITNEVGKV